MDKTYFSRVCNYKATMAQVERMKKNKLIYNEEYDQIESMIAKKYSLSFCNIFRDNNLIYALADGNMSH